MIEPNRERRIPIADAMQWVSQITSVSFMLALPALGGYWLDVYCHTGPWLLIVGACLGLFVSFFQLLQIAGVLKPSSKSGKSHLKK